METIGASELNQRLDEVIDRMVHGETFEITKNGRLIGRLMPSEVRRDRVASAAALKRLKAMKGTFGKITAEELKAMVHEGHRY